MFDMLLKGYEFLAVILPFLFTFLLFSHIYKMKNIQRRKWSFLKTFLFFVYILGVFHFTGVGTMYDLLRFGIRLNDGGTNLALFSGDFNRTEHFLNILLFLPFGFLLPFVWPHTKGLKYIVLSGFSFSSLIELSQLFNPRSTDIDDLVLNTFGALIGFLIYCLLTGIKKGQDRPLNYIRHEPAAYILIMFLGHFLIFNELGLAKILYGF